MKNWMKFIALFVVLFSVAAPSLAVDNCCGEDKPCCGDNAPCCQ